MLIEWSSSVPPVIPNFASTWNRFPTAAPSLREFLAEISVSVPVSRLAKWKTVVQMVAIGFLIVGDAGWHVFPVVEIGMVGIWLAALLTLYTGYDYLRAGLQHMLAMQEDPDAGIDSKSGPRAHPWSRAGSDLGRTP